MQRKNVESSNLKSIGHDFDKKILEIEFHSGGIYQYYQVPRFVYNNLMKADSHGRFFNTKIKDVFRYSKIK